MERGSIHSHTPKQIFSLRRTSMYLMCVSKSRSLLPLSQAAQPTVHCNITALNLNASVTDEEIYLDNRNSAEISQRLAGARQLMYLRVGWTDVK